MLYDVTYLNQEGREDVIATFKKEKDAHEWMMKDIQAYIDFAAKNGLRLSDEQITENAYQIENHGLWQIVPKADEN